MSRTAVIRVQRGADLALADLRRRFLAAWPTGDSQGEVVVFGDCGALLEAGLIERDADVRVRVPCAELRTDFALRGAA